METEVLIIVLSIFSTIITALLGAVSYLYKSKKQQRTLKQQKENALEEFKTKYFIDLQKLNAISHLLNSTKKTEPDEMLKTLKELIKDNIIMP